MKKYIAVLVSLSMVPLSSSYANGNSEPSLIELAIADAIQEEATATEAADQASMNSLITQVLGSIEAAEAEPATPAQVMQGHEEVYQYLRHNDLRAAAKDDQNLQDTSKDILMTIKENAYVFSGANTAYYMDKDAYGNPHDKDGGLTALGPEGSNSTDSSGKPFYQITEGEHRTERRKNVIFSASFERIIKTSPTSYDMDLMLFMHSDSTGHIFRFINITVDRSLKNTNITKINSQGERVNISAVRFNSVLKEIPLSQTDFEIRVELSTQKAILFDKNLNGITKVIPVTAGSIDVREGPNGTSVDSMTLLLPNTGKRIQYKDFELADTVLVRRTEWYNYKWNTNERIYDPGYKGRPFIALVDRSQLPKNADGTFKKYKMTTHASGRKTFARSGNDFILDPNGSPLYEAGYRQIGFHFQIALDELKRGFESHGCIRLQDHDLYTIDAIVNSGPNITVPIEVKMYLDNDKYKELDSVYARSGGYKKVLYTTDAEPDSFVVHCKTDSNYPVRSFMGRDGQRYHTIADSGCLSTIKPSGRSVEALNTALAQKSYSGISTGLWSHFYGGSAYHNRIERRRVLINENTNYVSALAGEGYQFNPYGSRSVQLAQISLAADIKSCINNPNLEKCSSTPVAPAVDPTTSYWPAVTITSRNQQVRDAKREYRRKCEGQDRNSRPLFTQNRPEFCRGRLEWLIKYRDFGE